MVGETVSGVDVAENEEEMTADYVRDNAEMVLCILADLLSTQPTKSALVSEYAATLQGARVYHSIDRKQALISLRVRLDD